MTIRVSKREQECSLEFEIRCLEVLSVNDEGLVFVAVFCIFWVKYILLTSESTAYVYKLEDTYLLKPLFHSSKCI